MSLIIRVLHSPHRTTSRHRCHRFARRIGLPPYEGRASYSEFCLLPSSFMWPPADLHHTASIPPPYRLACCKAPPGGRKKKVECRMQNPEAGYARPCVKITHCREPSRSHLGANAEGRMQNEERPGEATSCDINATSKPPQCVLLARR
jgi:hypothetical protein